MSFVVKLLNWYDQNARVLPWRSHVSPYRTWISEIMLQQTQVETMIPYFTNWMMRFPDIKALSTSDEQEVLSLWEGLGYYSRARNLHAAAKIVISDHQGQLPRSLKALQKLPGIGPYTAAAIASIAFGEDVAAVDGNIRRVLSRLFNVSEPARSTAGEKKIWALAEKYLPERQASAYNQALMDLGAIICTPKSPDCGQCPLTDYCLAYKFGIQEERPVKLPRKKQPHLTVTAAVIQQNGQFLLAKRPPTGLLGGLWEFPGGTLEEQDQDLITCLMREIQEELGVQIHVGAPFGEYHHTYTHFKMTLFAYLCTLLIDEQPQPLASEALAWLRPEDMSEYPMGKVDRQIAQRLLKEGTDGILSS